MAATSYDLHYSDGTTTGGSPPETDRLLEGGSPRMQARQASPYLRWAHTYHRARKRWKTVLMLTRLGGRRTTAFLRQKFAKRFLNRRKRSKQKQKA